ncbi:helix-turn-helix transcriptional regulator [Mycolicibacterium phlei]|uniref:helix-turn-helix transcriptional regulator n=1 Tax=Mycolicibacterium phlei TaxID=1771 RepID=UPI0002F432C7|nr:helix-turn-helix domain-containing protein [Mycolicibacterium phlei]MBF4194701.1 excisionase family DNA-binding domain-containing protein [Mycolicibacterium phlei]
MANEDLPELLTMQQFAELSKISYSTLRKWRHYGKGPKFARIGGRVFIRRQDAEDWINSFFEEAS